MPGKGNINGSPLTHNKGHTNKYNINIYFIYQIGKEQTFHNRQWVWENWCVTGGSVN